VLIRHPNCLDIWFSQLTVVRYAAPCFSRPLRQLTGSANGRWPKSIPRAGARLPPHGQTSTSDALILRVSQDADSRHRECCVLHAFHGDFGPGGASQADQKLFAVGVIPPIGSASAPCRLFYACAAAMACCSILCVATWPRCRAAILTGALQKAAPSTQGPSNNRIPSDRLQRPVRRAGRPCLTTSMSPCPPRRRKSAIKTGDMPEFNSRKVLHNLLGRSSIEVMIGCTSRFATQLIKRCRLVITSKTSVSCSMTLGKVAVERRPTIFAPTRPPMAAARVEEPIMRTFRAGSPRKCQPHRSNGEHLSNVLSRTS